ncbi:SDR family NAD(P)-dependent oxidoreductase [Planctomonas sp. JC2975]|uniref:SDR family NAD(P)-dependent oxidoreductase n=1 Tax=Planctomonas sp. JC2975 TaxID=2729626 RepID=UPI0014746039|nr:SDR family NAD(P)-dependent oxidoreductase [Planctomonas sp. JC2975]NNC13161.1 SDR family NAD(P)-dependent oxidoreductase [Planctomonas sp. JC2975]
MSGSGGSSGSKRTVVITGASSGIGEYAAGVLARQGDRVVVVGRNAERTRAVADRIGGEALLADFERLDDVRELASALLKRLDRIDVLANNAGGLYGSREVTVDGHERTIQTNHLAPFLLTHLLHDRLVESAKDAPVRVVSTASMANMFGSLRLDDLDWEQRPWRGGWQAYGTSKLATILFARRLGELLTGTGVSAYSFHPGTIVTRFGGQSPLIRFGNAVTGGRYGRSPESGAGPLIALAGEAEVREPSGTYFDRFTANGRVNAQARDPQLERDLWDATRRLLGIGDTRAASESAG